MRAVTCRAAIRSIFQSCLHLLRRLGRRSLVAAIALASGSLLVASAPAAPALAATTGPLAVVTSSLGPAIAGYAYTAKLDAGGGTKPYTWSLADGSSLPPGLSLHASTGNITGTPVSGGTFNFTAEVTDSENSPVSATAPESITVTVIPLTVTAVTLPAATAGVPYSVTLSASGGVAPYSWSIADGYLPTGLKLHPASGVISGTPTAGGTFTFVAEVADSEPAAQTASASELITAGVAALVVTTGSTLPTATTGVPYSVKLSAAGGLTPDTWSLASGSSLPAGLTLKSTGLISGTTTVTGLDSFTVQVSDSETPAVTATANVMLYVVNPMAVSTGLPAADADQPYDTSLQTTGGLAPYSYAITSGELPQGLSLLPDGEITGQASAAGSYSFTVSVTDSENPPATVTQAESIAVAAAAMASPTLYWAEDDYGNIWATPVNGSPAVLASGQVGPADVTVVNGTVYWADSGDGTIMEVPVTGGTPTVLASGENGVAFAIDNGTVYWADSGDGTIMEVPVTGGTPTVLASGLDDPVSVVADGGLVYWADGGDGTIMDDQETAGAAPSVLGADTGGPYHTVDGLLAVDGRFVYWVDDEGEVMAVPTTPGQFPSLLATGQNVTTNLTANNGTVYWGTADGGIWAATPAGDGAISTPTQLVSASDFAAYGDSPAYLAADSSVLYWFNTDTDEIMAVSTAGGTVVGVVQNAGFVNGLTLVP